MNEGDTAAEMLTAGEVCRLLHVVRSTLPLWRKRGALIGVQPVPGGDWRYPSNQPAIENARAALRGRA